MGSEDWVSLGWGGRDRVELKREAITRLGLGVDIVKGRYRVGEEGETGNRASLQELVEGPVQVGRVERTVCVCVKERGYDKMWESE